MRKESNCPALAVEDVAGLSSLLRQDAHRLNNLILVVLGNVDLLYLEHQEDIDAFHDVNQALRECREIAMRLLNVGCKLSNDDKYDKQMWDIF